MKTFLEKVFHIQERGSTITREIFGGLTTFLAMFYILPVNSGMLSGINIFDGVNTTEFGAIFLATAIASGITTILMGIYANFPVALSSGMGVNAFVAFTVCGTLGYNYAEALGLTFVAGTIFVIISVTPLRTWILNAIPKNLKLAVGAGIGFFIAFLGLKNSGIVVPNASTYVSLGDFTRIPVLMAIIGIVLVLILGHINNKKVASFAVIISLFVMGITDATIGQIAFANGGADALKAIDMPTFYTDGFSYQSLGSISNIFAQCFVHGMDAFARPETYAVLFALLFVDFFDTAGTLVAVGEEAGIIDKDGNITNSQRALTVDSLGTCIGAVTGTTTITSFVESTTGISAGARTGFSSVVCGLLFLLAIGAYPALGMFGSTPSGLAPVTSLALVYVGTLMFRQLKDIDWEDGVATASGFITIIVMVLSYSISDGIAWGFISYALMSIAAGKGKKVGVLMYCLAAFFILYYVLKMLVINKF
jgi:adenine/guanine/hypoxanthine permease